MWGRYAIMHTVSSDCEDDDDEDDEDDEDDDDDGDDNDVMMILKSALW